MSNPVYVVGDVLYLRESAALGSLEPVTISGIISRGDEWLYAVRFDPTQLTSATNYGDRISLVQGTTVVYAESEFVTLCVALELMEANLERQLTGVRNQLAVYCTENEDSEEPTASTEATGTEMTG